jgi:hypothetical protein
MAKDPGVWFENADAVLSSNVGGDVNTYTATAPAISVTDKIALLDASSNAVAATLANSTLVGKVITVKATDVTNATTLVPATLLDGTTITFTPANEYIVLAWVGSDGWAVVGGNAAIT